MSDKLSLEMKNIKKSYPGVQALKGVDFDLEYGEVHGLLGENGAGKSTLMKMLGGVEKMDSGEVRIGGEPVVFHSPYDAQQMGVSFIHQELSLFPDLDIATNIFIQDIPKTGSFIRYKELYDRAGQILEEIGLSGHSPKEIIKYLQMGERQLVEIGRCLTIDTRILVLDEPTSSLTKKEVETLFSLIRKLKSQGISIIFISHRMDEVFEICDRITVMRDGEKIATVNAKETTTNHLVSLMIGRELGDRFERSEYHSGEELLKVEGLGRGEKFQDINFTINAGEIVGLYGLMGSGRSEIVRSVFGLEKYDTGKVYMEGEEIHVHSPEDAIEKGIGLITENRREEGLMVRQSVGFNLMAANFENFCKKPFGFMDTKKETEVCDENVKELNIKTPSLKQKAKFLSGGNQQKVVIAKWLNRSPKVLILDEPTRGVDVGAKFEIYHILEEEARKGKGLFVISSELDEIMGLCDRILVIRKGKIVGELSHTDFTKEKLLESSMGGKDK